MASGGSCPRGEVRGPALQRRRGACGVRDLRVEEWLPASWRQRERRGAGGDWGRAWWSPLLTIVGGDAKTLVLVAIRSRSVSHRRPGSLETNGRQSRVDNVGREQSSATRAATYLVWCGNDVAKCAMLVKANATAYPGQRHGGDAKSAEPVKTGGRVMVCPGGSVGGLDKPATACVSAKMRSCVVESHGPSHEDAMSPSLSSPTPLGSRADVEMTHVAKGLY